MQICRISIYIPLKFGKYDFILVHLSWKLILYPRLPKEVTVGDWSFLLRQLALAFFCVGLEKVNGWRCTVWTDNYVKKILLLNPILESMARGLFYIEVIFQIHRLYQFPIYKRNFDFYDMERLTLELRDPILNCLKWQVTEVEIFKSKACYGVV